MPDLAPGLEFRHILKFLILIPTPFKPDPLVDPIPMLEGKLISLTGATSV